MPCMLLLLTTNHGNTEDNIELLMGIRMVQVIIIVDEMIPVKLTSL